MVNLRLWFNMIVNALSMLALSALAATGLLIHYVLPHGSGGPGTRFGYGRMKPAFSYLGLTRHEWGEIHFYIALLFLILLAIHLLLNWNWIKCIAWGTKEKPQSVSRRLMTAGIVIWLILVFSLPFIFEKQTINRVASGGESRVP